MKISKVLLSVFYLFLGFSAQSIYSMALTCLDDNSPEKVVRTVRRQLINPHSKQTAEKPLIADRQQLFHEKLTKELAAYEQLQTENMSDDAQQLLPHMSEKPSKRKLPTVSLASQTQASAKKQKTPVQIVSVPASTYQSWTTASLSSSSVSAIQGKPQSMLSIYKELEQSDIDLEQLAAIAQAAANKKLAGTRVHKSAPLQDEFDPSGDESEQERIAIRNEQFSKLQFVPAPINPKQKALDAQRLEESKRKMEEKTKRFMQAQAQAEGDPSLLDSPRTINFLTKGIVLTNKMARELKARGQADDLDEAMKPPFEQRFPMPYIKNHNGTLRRPDMPELHYYYKDVLGLE